METVRILVVEDESIVAMDIQDRLETLGYLVVGTAATGERAVERALALQPNLILMDIRLKGEMDGIEAATQILKHLNIPIIFLTANADAPTIERAKRTNPFGYVLKPFEERDLQTAIEMALYKHRTDAELKKREQWLTATLSCIGDAVVATDCQGRITFMNPQAVSMTGWQQADAVGQELAQVFVFLNEQRNPVTRDLVAAAVAGAEAVDSLNNLIMITRDGVEIPIENNATPIKDVKDQTTGIVLVFRDITERRRAAEDLRLSEERYALAAQAANDGLWDWSLGANRVYFSPRWKAMLGYEEHEIENHTDAWFQRIHEEDRKAVKTTIAHHLEGRSKHFECEHRMLHKDGSYRWMMSRGIALCDATGKRTRVAGSQSDITERKVAEQQLLHDAFHDALTELPNRALFLDRLKLAIARAKRHDEHRFTVLFLDLDRFKIINDSLGHMIGDQLLIGVANRLKSVIRAGDTISRLGGDEFTILLEDLTDGTEVIRIAERIQECIGLPFKLSNHEAYTTVSIGIVAGTSDYDRPEDILRDADTAMYRAKAAGKARYEVFENTMYTRAVSLLQIETDLRQALERNELVLYYQPILTLNDEAIRGFEALIRWQHPTLGLVPPNDFIPLAEETGLILPIGRWVIQKACQQIRCWQNMFPQHPPLHISVNVSAKQLLEAGLVDYIQEVILEQQIPPHCLKLEITETSLIDKVERVKEVLETLRAQGMDISIDDFGTGYSSLSYLRNFPISTLKIDRSFIHSITADPDTAEFARTIVTLARNLNLSVVAEGIETAEQAAQLKTIACDYGQGYLFSKPQSADKITTLLHEHEQRHVAVKRGAV